MARLKVVDGRGFVVLKDLDFTDGTIEFDIFPTNRDFAAFFFRFQDTAETETFYLRTNWAVNHPYAMESVQYTPIVKGVMYWDALPQYQTFSDYTLSKPSHVKMIVSGRQMKVWVNHPERPTLEVPRLEGDVTHGTLAFQGEQMITNLVVKPGQTNGLSVADHAAEIERFGGSALLDYVLYNDSQPSPELMRRYASDQEFLVEIRPAEFKAVHYKAIGRPLIADEEVKVSPSDRLAHHRSLIRHDAKAVAVEIVELIRNQ